MARCESITFFTGSSARRRHQSSEKDRKSVDDRSINQHALHHLAKELANRSYSGPLQVVEVGPGIGTMLERLMGWQILPDVCYQAIDLEPANIKEARRLFPVWSSAMGVEMTKTPSGGELSAKDGSHHITVGFDTMDMYDWIAGQGENNPVDLLIAHAFMEDSSIGNKLINARAETINEKPRDLSMEGL